MKGQKLRQVTSVTLPASHRNLSLKNHHSRSGGEGRTNQRSGRHRKYVRVIPYYSSKRSGLAKEENRPKSAQDPYFQEISRLNEAKFME